MRRITYLLLLASLMFQCTTPQDSKLDIDPTSKKSSLRNEMKNMNPGWTLQYWEQKLEEGQERPEMMSALMREKQATDYRLKSGAALLKNITEVGPDNIAGRVRSIVQDSQNPDRILAGAISGGIWETLDKGENWAPMTDRDQNLSVTSITQSISDPNIWYYSCGEVTGNSADLSGPGIFKSSDNGKTWTLLPATQITAFASTWRIACSIEDSDRFFVASPDGLFMIEENGENITQLLFENVTDLHITSRGDLYAAVSGKGVFWAERENYGSIAERDNSNIAPGAWSRCVIDVFEVDDDPSNDILYMLSQDVSSNRLHAFHRSNNGGDMWIPRINPGSTGISFNYTWYTMALAIHPTDPDKVVVASVGIGYTTNGGIAWNNLTGGHVDRHVLLFDIESEDRFFVGSDGGIDYIHAIPRRAWQYDKTLNNGLNITQFYTGAYHPTENIALGGTQDNGTLLSNPINQTARQVYGADGSYCAIDPLNPDRAYVSFQNGNIFRTENVNDPNPIWINIENELDGDGDGEIDEGATFINPYFLNLERPNELFFMTRNNVWYSDNYGNNWRPFTENTSLAHSVALDTISSGATRALIGGAGGGLFFIPDVSDHQAGDEQALKSIFPRSISRAFIGKVIFSKYDSTRAYLAFSSFSQEPRIWQVDSLYTNPTVSSISGNLPEFLPVNSLQQSPIDSTVFIAGTDYGVYVTSDRGKEWNLVTEIPNAPVADVFIRDTDLRFWAFTHGRGIWTGEVEKLIVSSNEPTVEIVSCYPNPAESIIKLVGMDAYNIENASLIALSTGRSTEIAINEDAQISVVDLNAGYYIIQMIMADGQRKIAKFLKI